eukprot:gene20094-40113_t
MQAQAAAPVPLQQQVSPQQGHAKKVQEERQERLRSRGRDRETDRREDPTVKQGGNKYTFAQFCTFYGPKDGRKKWQQAGRILKKHLGNGVDTKDTKEKGHLGDGVDPREPRPDPERGEKRFPYENFRDAYPEDYKKRWKKAGQLLKKWKKATPTGKQEEGGEAKGKKKKWKKGKKKEKEKGKGQQAGSPGGSWGSAHEHPALKQARKDTHEAEQEVNRLRRKWENKVQRLKKLEENVAKTKEEGLKVEQQMKEAIDKLETQKQVLEDEKMEYREAQHHGAVPDEDWMEEDEQEKEKDAAPPSGVAGAAPQGVGRGHPLGAATDADKAAANARREASRAVAKAQEEKKKLEEEMEKMRMQLASERSLKEQAQQEAAKAVADKDAYAADAAAQQAAAQRAVDAANASAGAAQPQQVAAAAAARPQAAAPKSPKAAKPSASEIPSPSKLEDMPDDKLQEIAKKFELKVGEKPSTGGRPGVLQRWRTATMTAISGLRAQKEKRHEKDGELGEGGDGPSKRGRAAAEAAAGNDGAAEVTGGAPAARGHKRPARSGSGAAA